MQEKVLEIMSKTFNIDISLLSVESSKNDLFHWDSMTHLNLIVDIENEFKIAFENDEIISIVDFKSLMQNIINKLEKK